MYKNELKMHFYLFLFVFWVTQVDSEMPRKISCGVLLPAAEKYGPCSQFVAGESDNGNFLVG